LLLALKHAASKRHQALRTSDQVDEFVEESLLAEEVVVRSSGFHAFEDEQNYKRVRRLSDPNMDSLAKEERLDETLSNRDENEDV
jgi:hypothetical protein